MCIYLHSRVYKHIHVHIYIYIYIYMNRYMHKESMADSKPPRRAASHARPFVGVSQSQVFRDLVNFWR
jgi:hypothetical protein